jgi:hypothetical protein
MNARPNRNTIEEIALIMSIEPSYVEKDWFVTQIIALLAGADYGDFKLVFTGGTALSKAHSIINRYSEDIDYRVMSPKHLQTRSHLSRFKNYIVGYLNKNGFIIPDNRIRARNNNRYFTIEINYETHFDRHIALRPHIQIEMSVRAPQLVTTNRAISSFINEISNLPPEAIMVSCSDPIESAADKLSAITWRIPDRIRHGEYDDPSIVRHIHDLAILGKVIVNEKLFASLAINSMQDDLNRSKNNLNFSSQSLRVKLTNMLSILENDHLYPKEYKHFVESMSYAPYDKTPKYEEALTMIKSLVNKVLNTHL